jgi:cardiolipin synthase (CMP-forming)
VSDKVLVIALMLALMQQLAIPLWLVVVVIGRDLLVVGGAALLRFRVKNFRVEPLIIGKLCTFLQLVLIGFVLGGLARLADTALVESILIPAVAVVTLASAMAYVATGIRVARGAAGTD